MNDTSSCCNNDSDKKTAVLWFLIGLIEVSDEAHDALEILQQ